MTGAGRLSSGPQPVTANAAPLCLSFTVYRAVHGGGDYLCSPPLPVRDGSPKGENPTKPGFQRQPTARSRRETPIFGSHESLPVSAPVKLGQTGCPGIDVQDYSESAAADDGSSHPELGS
jgi:hypothetical protein